MTFVHLLPVVLATWLLGAHFFRAGATALAVCFGAVAVLTLASALVFRGAALRKRYSVS